METNNIEFIKIRNQLRLSLLIYIVVYSCISDRNILFIVGIGCVLLMYVRSFGIISQLYKEMRDVIAYAYEDKQAVIKDGDLGLLYEEMKRLKQRTEAYEQTLNTEKDKLRQTMEDICHQLKTPLTSISIYNELLMDGEIQKDYFIEMDQQIEKMKYLINSLLKLAKLDGSQIDFDFQYLSIQKVFELSVQSVRSLIKQYHVDISIQPTDLYLYYDESWLQEALSNIMKNSIEHHSRSIDVSFENHSQYLKIKIHNDGDEIDDKDLPHIFERFYHHSTNGVGIGLSLSKQIIYKHHGSLSVYNQEGVVFEIVLPMMKMNDKYKLS